MTDDTILPFSFPAVQAKKVTAAFDGGRLTSNGGVMLLAMAERRLGLADNLARVFPDRRDPTRVERARSHYDPPREALQQMRQQHGTSRSAQQSHFEGSRARLASGRNQSASST